MKNLTVRKLVARNSLLLKRSSAHQNDDISLAVVYFQESIISKRHCATFQMTNGITCKSVKLELASPHVAGTDMFHSQDFI